MDFEERMPVTLIASYASAVFTMQTNHQGPAVMDKVAEYPKGAAVLPVALCAEILKLVPQQDRLCQCALVCESWAQAAVQASMHVQHVLHVDDVPAFQHWMTLHASHLRSLKLAVRYDAQQILQLPLGELEQLQSLQLQGFKLQLFGEDESWWESSSDDISFEDDNDAARPALPHLQYLELSDVELLNVSSLLQVPDAPQLRNLILNKIGFAKVPFSSHDWPRAKDAVQQVADAIASFLQRMPHLSVLELPGFPFTDAAVQQTAVLHELQDISLTQAACVPAFDLQQLPSSITRLQLCDDSPYDSPGLPRDLLQLSGLLHLDLRSCTVPATLLASVTQLQELLLEDCRLLPEDRLDDSGAGGTIAFLDVLTQLTCLQNLTLYQQPLETDIVAPQHFSALTASSQLSRLYVLQPDEMPLPRGAVQHMFPPGRQMPFLQHITISPGRDIAPGDAPPDDDPYGGPPPPPPEDWCMDADDMGRVFSACKALQDLDITSSSDPKASKHMSVLLQLPPSCTSLQIGGEAFTNAAAPFMAQLTQLEYLELTWSKGLTDSGLEQLESLDQLRDLLVQGSGVSDKVTSVGTMGPGAVALGWHPELGSVSQQLGEKCDLSPPLASSRLHKHKAAAAAREQELRWEISNLRAEVARLQAEAAMHKLGSSCHCSKA